MVQKSSLHALTDMAQTVFDKKGFNILALDVREVCNLTNFFLIAEGNIDKHVIALAKAILKTMKDEGMLPERTEGLKDGDWVVLDFGEIVVHLFMPGMRERYRLEELWQAGKIVDLELMITK